MPYHFVTKGPFTLTCSNGELSPVALSSLWKQEKELARAFGVYIFARAEGNQLIPVYVGKSDCGFSKRLNTRHSIFEKVKGVRVIGDLRLFLIARVTTKKKRYKPPTRKYFERGPESDFRRQPIKLKSVSRLEFALIGDCLRVNRDLVNEQEKAFHCGFVVPGYLDNADDERDEGASALAAMLKIQ